MDVLTASPAGLDALAMGLFARGVSGFLPTLVPQPLDEMATTVSRLSAWMGSRRPGDGRGALPMGIHFEGPFVSAARCGALRREDFLDGTDSRAMGGFFEIASGLPGRGMTTLAPEIPGGIAVVREFVKRGFVVSIGHTEADVAALDAALAAGARHMTHFGNAMKPLHHRGVGPVGWGLITDGVTVDVIADGHHLSKEMLRLVLKAKGASRVALISDAMPAAGLADGDYSFWGGTLTVKDGAARNASGALAGSTALLDDCVARLASVGVTEEAAHRMASDVPRAVFAG
ncbi:MAG: amidohydrolase family protein [Thermoanaerobaculia bacterium]|nr:amidohydrolase family protein [Thermoanaerobaculia bacterium]